MAAHNARPIAGSGVRPRGLRPFAWEAVAIFSKGPTEGRSRTSTLKIDVALPARKPCPAGVRRNACAALDARVPAHCNNPIHEPQRRYAGQDQGMKAFRHHIVMRVPGILTDWSSVYGTRTVGVRNPLRSRAFQLNDGSL
jgi:hypothetical protein